MENLIIKGNEIKEQGFFGKTVYVIKNNEIREPGLFGRTVYVIKGNEIKEPGFLGKTVYIIDGDTIKTPGIFGGAFLGTVVAKTKKDGRIIQCGENKVDTTYNTQAEKQQENIQNNYSTNQYSKEESLKELEERLDIKTGCVLDYTNCFEKTTYTIPKKYRKLTAVAPALKNLQEIKIHKDVCIIVGKNVRVANAFVVEEENEYYSSENGILYNKDKSKIIKVPFNYDLSNFTISSTVKSIEENAFWGCTINNITIPNNVIKISKSAFAYCKKFKQIYIPLSVVCIEEDAFIGNNALQITTEFEDYPLGWSKNIKSNNKEIIWNTIK